MTRAGQSLLGCTLVAGWVVLAATAPVPPEEERLQLPDGGLSGRERIVHALNRLGYGPRPGEVERIEREGLADYLEAQLQPERLADPEVERRLTTLPTLAMSQIELLAAYPSPTLIRGIVERAGRLGIDEEALQALFPELGEMDLPAEVPRPVGARGNDGPRRIGAELGQAKLVRAIYSERQLEQVMVDFWFNHFNVFLGKGPVRWMTGSYERDAIRPHALGKFRDLLGAVARHPAMLFYLDNWKSSYEHSTASGATLMAHEARVADALGLPPGGLVTLVLRERGMDTTALERRIKKSEAWQRYRAGGASRARRQSQFLGGVGGPPRGLNENFARELLELHTLGVDGGYSQQDVIEVARCFSGWTLTRKFGGYQFMFVPELHDRRKHSVLGVKIAGAGIEQGEQVLDLLAGHPATARFISIKLARRFVSDDPPPALIDRLAGVFLESDGDIRQVLRALIASEALWSREAARSKLKTPLEFVASAVRATGGELAPLVEGRRDVGGEVIGGETMVSGKPPGLQFHLNRLGQPLYAARPPTGYDDTARSWVSTGALLERMKFALGLVGNRVPGVELPRLPDGEVVHLAVLLLGRDPSPATPAAIAELLALGPEELRELGIDPRLARSRRHRTRLATGLLLASAEFQRR